MKRGDLVPAVLPGDYGKPRPALVIQSDLFQNTGMVTVAPLTSTLLQAPMARISVRPSQANGLRQPSEVMIDMVMSVRSDRLGSPFGRLEEDAMRAVNRALALFLGIVT